MKGRSRGTTFLCRSLKTLRDVHLSSLRFCKNLHSERYFKINLSKGKSIVKRGKALFSELSTGNDII